MTTFAGIKSTKALKKQTDLPQHLCTSTVCRFSTKKDVSSVSVSTNSGVLWCFPHPDWDPAGYICAAWYVWLWDVRIKWSPSPSGGLRHKHKATSVSLLLTASWRCWLVYTWIMTMNHAVINAEFAVCLFTMSASASLLKSFSRFTSCSPISWEVSLHRRRVHICPRVCY